MNFKFNGASEYDPNRKTISVAWREQVKYTNLTFDVEESFRMFILELCHETLHVILDNFISYETTVWFDNLPIKTLMTIDHVFIPRKFYLHMKRVWSDRGRWE